MLTAQALWPLTCMQFEGLLGMPEADHFFEVCNCKNLHHVITVIHLDTCSHGVTEGRVFVVDCGRSRSAML
jgi:hypothetical protein